MNKVHRTGFEPANAFRASALRQFEPPQPVAKAADVPAGAATAGPQPAAAGAPATAEGWRQWLRPVLGRLYRLAKPVVRPLMFRFRRSMTENLRNELIQEMQRLAAAAAEDRRETRAMLERFRADVAESVNGRIRLELQALRAEFVSASVQHSQTQARVAGLRDELFPRLDRIEQYGYATARRVAVNCGNGEIMIRTAVGFVLCAADDHALLACLLDSGELERGTRLLIQRVLRPGDVFIDVGANIGMHTLAAAQALAGRGRIIAFEPFETSARLLRGSLAVNGHSDIVTLHQAAVSNAAGRQRLFLGAASGHHSLFPLGTSAGASDSAHAEVQLLRLDAVVDPAEPVRLIKIDVEGAELEVLESAAALIRANRDVALIVEYGPSHLARVGQTSEAWFAAFEALGLQYRMVEPLDGRLVPCTVAQLNTLESANLFFTRRDSQAWADFA